MIGLLRYVKTLYFLSVLEDDESLFVSVFFSEEPLSAFTSVFVSLLFDDDAPPFFA